MTSTRGNVLVSTPEERKTPPLLFNVLAPSPPHAYNPNTFLYPFQCNVLRWANILGVLERGKALEVSGKVVFMKLKSFKPIEGHKKRRKKKGKPLPSFMGR